MKKYLSKTTIDLAAQVIGTIASIGYAGASVFLYSHGLDAKTYGAFSVLFSVLMLLAGIIELGVQNVIFARVPQLGDDTSSLLKFTKSIWLMVTAAGLLVLGAFTVTFPWLDAGVYRTGLGLGVAALSSVTIMALAWRNIVAYLLIAKKQIVLANVLGLITNIAQLLMVTYWYLDESLTPMRIVFSLLITTALVTVVGIAGHLKRYGASLFAAHFDSRMVGLRFTLGNFLTQQTLQLTLRTDLLLLSAFGILSARADYALAQKIVITLSAFVFAIFQLLAPQMARLHSLAEVRDFIQKRAALFIIPYLFLGLVILVPEQLFTLVFTAKFQSVTSLTHLMAFVYMLYITVQMFELVLLYTFRKVRILLVSSVLMLGVTVASGYLLIPKYEYHGALGALALGFLSGVIMRAWAIYTLRKVSSR